MKKPKLEVNEQPQPRNVQRADIAPKDGYALVVDARFKTQFAEKGVAMKAATEIVCPSIRCCRSKFTTHRRGHEPWLSCSKSALRGANQVFSFNSPLAFRQEYQLIGRLEVETSICP